MTTPSSNSNNWDAYAQLVLHTLDRFEGCFKSVQDELNGLKVEITQLRSDIGNNKVEAASCIAELKVKSGIWGAIAGLIPAAIASIYFMINQHGK